MRKFIYALVALLAAFTTTSCLYGVGTDEGADVEDTSGFKVEVSATVISANGEDSAVFRAFYNGEDVSSEATLYDNATNSPYPTMSFSTEMAGRYQFYVVWGEYRSDVIAITVFQAMDLSDKDEKGLSVSLSTNLIQVGKQYAAFIIRYDGKVLEPEEMAKAKIYNAETNSGVAFETVAVSYNGKDYVLPAYYANKAGQRSYWVSYKTKNTRETPVTITAVTAEVPARPVDPEPSKTEFVHRTLFTQMTGTWCGYCPNMIEAFHRMFEDEQYKDRFVHTAVHNGDQFAVKLPDGRDLANVLNTSGAYPFTIANLSYGLNTPNSVEANIAAIMGTIESTQSTPARAGIAVRTSLKDNMLLVRASVKVNEDGEYAVGAWLVESGLYAPQSNYTENKESYIDIHENVVRIANSNASGSNFRGLPMGHISKGETADQLFIMELDRKWKVENCHLVLFVSTTINKQQTVTNAVQTASLTSGVEFEYK
jgi:hypothetical protein